MEVTGSALVHEMNRHLGEALQLIGTGIADHTSQIREEMKQFFAIAEQIECEIAKKEVASINKVKNDELGAILQQIEQVNAYLAAFRDTVSEVVQQLRGVLDETMPMLEC
jgi:hypothetical protein